MAECPSQFYSVAWNVSRKRFTWVRLTLVYKRKLSSFPHAHALRIISQVVFRINVRSPLQKSAAPLALLCSSAQSFNSRKKVGSVPFVIFTN